MPDIREKARRISINELPSEIPDFTSTYEPKDSVIKKWITDWILSAVKAKKIKENDILPSKSEISDYLGVSTGTIQNAIRYVEDEGLLKSKQKTGTMISNLSSAVTPAVKSTSKREKAITAIKQAIISDNYKPNRPIPSTRKMSEYIGISQNTVRLAYEYLCSVGILESMQMRGNDSNWYLKKIPQLSDTEIKNADFLSSDTLVDKLTETLKTFLAANFNVGDRIPSHDILAEKLNTSAKTINDCMKKLNQQSIVITRRGKYGSILAQNPVNPIYEPLKENSVFAKAKDAEFYYYQTIEKNLTELINKNFTPGDKLPSMSELAKIYNVSTNTIRKALTSLEQQGCISFSRGRQGGTFVLKKPQDLQGQTYQWLSINPDYM